MAKKALPAANRVSSIASGAARAAMRLGSAAFDKMFPTLGRILNKVPGSKTDREEYDSKRTRTSLDASFSKNNDTFNAIIDAQSRQNQLLEQILSGLKRSSNPQPSSLLPGLGALGGGSDNGSNIPDLPGLDRPERQQKPTPPAENRQRPNRRTRSGWSKFMRFLRRRAPALFARVGTKLAASAVLAATPIVGWLALAVTIGFAVSDVYALIQLWQEFNSLPESEQDDDEDDDQTPASPPPSPEEITTAERQQEAASRENLGDVSQMGDTQNVTQAEQPVIQQQEAQSERRREQAGLTENLEDPQRQRLIEAHAQAQRDLSRNNTAINRNRVTNTRTALDNYNRNHPISETDASRIQQPSAPVTVNQPATPTAPSIPAAPPAPVATPQAAAPVATPSAPSTSPTLAAPVATPTPSTPSSAPALSSPAATPSTPAATAAPGLPEPSATPATKEPVAVPAPAAPPNKPPAPAAPVTPELPAAKPAVKAPSVATPVVTPPVTPLAPSGPDEAPPEVKNDSEDSSPDSEEDVPLMELEVSADRETGSQTSRWNVLEKNTGKPSKKDELPESFNAIRLEGNTLIYDFDKIRYEAGLIKFEGEGATSRPTASPVNRPSPAAAPPPPPPPASASRASTAGSSGTDATPISAGSAASTSGGGSATGTDTAPISAGPASAPTGGGNATGTDTAPISAGPAASPTGGGNATRVNAPSVASIGGATPSFSGGDQQAMEMIKRHEGKRNTPYKDSLGLWTVGYGHLIGDGRSLPAEWNRTFSDQEIDALFAQDFAKHKAGAERIPGFDKANDSGKAAIIDLTFNMGNAWYRRFPNASAALARGDFETFANEMQNSLWFRQVGRRGPTIVAMLRAGGSGGSQTAATQTPSTPSSGGSIAQASTERVTAGREQTINSQRITSNFNQQSTQREQPSNSSPAPVSQNVGEIPLRIRMLSTFNQLAQAS